ncbi:FAD/NAD(P)-binding protein [Sphingomonas xanthus]|uniref:FAD-binding protein n=1 Tax=Sphingomonas xanthus TaxID=2594473 RepID=A0A516ITA6_9SPHN|nr:FAD/NAD(P)-binding protein [Sphingomonas xanthus]QDP20129.1 FAD-binding protein [Sphingomonas xanthus]
MKSECGLPADVLIVGGGFSGTALAAQLARRGLSATIVEGSGRAGRGTAYSTEDEAHLLNVPAAKMGAGEGLEDFAEVLAGEGYAPTDFVPRRRYGAYLAQQLERSGAKLIDATATSVEWTGGQWRLALDDGRSVEGRALALAQGNAPPPSLAVAKGLPEAMFVADPWSEAGREAIGKAAASAGPLLLVGTGLTMVDVALSLDRLGFGGKMVALSRRGLIPRAHQAFEPAPLELEEVPGGSILALSRWLRARSTAVGWRAAVDSLRPHSQTVWQTFSTSEQRRFLRHARPWWDVHRHRIAPQVASRIEMMIEGGRLEIGAGRLTALREEGGRLTAIIARRRGTQETIHAAMAVNCTGPLGDIRRSADGVTNSLFDAGLARPDPLGIAVEVDAYSRVTAAPRAWAIGPMAKGKFWEITAVPDIRVQAAAVADDMMRELGNG